MLSDIASGMSYMHDKFIMHRDLKPGNILLSNELSAKITDFGLSKLYSTDSGNMTKTCTVGKYFPIQYIQNPIRYIIIHGS